MGATVVAGNTNGRSCFRSPAGGVNDFGFNLDDDGTCGFTLSTDLSNTPAGLDPSGLQDHGGFTQTIAPQSGSPVIDAVTTASLCPAADQRGTPRTAPCDIGAYDTDTPAGFSVVAVTGSQTYGAAPSFSSFATTPAGVTLSGSVTCSTSGLNAGNDELDPSTCSGLTSSDASPVYYVSVPSGFVVSPDTSTVNVSTDVSAQPYGSESSTTFTVTVVTGNGEPIGSGEQVLVQVGVASCTVTLIPASGGGSGGCSFGERDLQPGVYTASASYGGDANITGSGPATTPFTVGSGTPDAPGIGTASATAITTASVQFDAPGFDGGSPIDSYTAACMSSNGGTTQTGTGSASPISVDGLTEGALYACTVSAHNAQGDGPQSDPSNSFLAALAPDAPTAVNAVSGSTTAATGPLSVSFTPGADNGGTTISFTATCTSSNGGVGGSNSGSASPVTVTGLTTAKSYTCTVTGTNVRGVGLLSSPSQVVVVGAPTSPTNVKATAGTGSATVTWAAPASNNGSPITEYVITPFLNGVAEPPKIYSSTALSESVTGLQKGETYTFEVAGGNARGIGTNSVISNSVKPK
jgi:hypothetical protein